MSLTREDMLRELELLPAWKLNQPLDVAERPQAPQALAGMPNQPQVELIPDTANEIASMDWVMLHQHVIGSGDPNADWLFVGDVPTEGDAALLLDKMLIAIQLQHGKNVYVTQLAEPEYFKRQIALIQPKLIFVFGEQAAQILLGSNEPLDALRGQLHQYENAALIASYAPSHLLKNTQDKAKAWADLCLARDAVQGIK